MTLSFRPSRAILGAFVLSVSLAACADPAGTTDTGPDEGAPLSVAVAFYPFEFVTNRVGGDLVTVENLTTPGTEPHDLELTPKQIGQLQSVELVVYQQGFQPAVDSAIEQANPKRTVDSASFLDLEPAQGDQDHDHDDHDDHDADGHDDHDADDHDADDHDGDGHDHGAFDPHTWLDPTNLAKVAEHVRDALIEARPDAKATLTANTAALVADLTALDSEFSSGLKECKIHTFVTSHDAFGYLAHRYGLEQVGIAGIEPDTEPTAARIAEVQRIAKAEGVTTIFFETLVSPVVAQSIAGDLGLKTEVLDPLEGLTTDSAGKDYLEVMRSNLTALKAANQCT